LYHNISDETHADRAARYARLAYEASITDAPSALDLAAAAASAYRVARAVSAPPQHDYADEYDTQTSFWG
jgi:hypothetical protein